MRRSERDDDSWSGHWSLPGGRREPSDPDILHTALRELEEECGVRLSPDALESALPLATARRRTGRYLLVAPFVFRIPGHLETVLDPAEAVEAFWIPVGMLLDPARHVFRPAPRRPHTMLFPAIELNCVPLWGFTYRLLTDWLLPPFTPSSGAEAARTVLHLLLSFGLPLVRDFSGRLASVAGPIPVAEVLAHFTGPRNFLPAVNCLDVAPHAVRVVGPEFEEYVIESVFDSK